jgi:nondiscriminating aspartyl-tRNA synthetase
VIDPMERILTSDLPALVGRRGRLAGWLHHQRQLGRITFVVLRDRAGLAQAVVEGSAQRAALAELLPETVVELEGDAVPSEQAPGGVELRTSVVRVVAEPAEQPPVELRRPRLREQLPTRLDAAAVSLRHPRERAKFAVAAAAMAGFRQALDRLGFVEIQTPKLVSSATEGGARPFPVDYFGLPAYLAQSPQLYKQVMVGVFERVYETGPAFRAEPHETGRHLAEYVSLDAELGFVDDHRTVMNVVREALAGMVESVRSRAGAAAELAGAELPEVPADVPAVDFREAERLLARPPEPDLSPEDERRLGEWARREHGSDFLFVTGFPIAKRPFYTHPDPERPDVTNSFDLLFRGLEVVTGGQRLHRYADYVDALTSRGLPTEPFRGYLDAFRYGMPPHGGFALGLERWVAQLVGARNIRETTLFPRDRSRLTP